jgi:hypothetical protein
LIDTFVSGTLPLVAVVGIVTGGLLAILIAMELLDHKGLTSVFVTRSLEAFWVPLLICFVILIIIKAIQAM